MDNKDEFTNGTDNEENSSERSNVETGKLTDTQSSQEETNEEMDIDSEVKATGDTQVINPVDEQVEMERVSENLAPRRNGPEGYTYQGGSSYAPYEKKKETGRKKGFSGFSLIAVALLFSLLGTVLGAYGTLNVLPGTALFNESKLGQLITANNGMKTVKISTPQLAKDGLTIPEIVSMVQPAVVTVTVNLGTAPSLSNPQGGYTQSIGTGFILNDDGLIATNYHVVEGGEEITVTLYTGEEVSAKVVNFDADNDLAILSLTQDVTIPGKVTLGDSDTLMVGESVIAIGNPLSQEFAGTVTSGIVSATDRTVVVDNAEYKYIQTDAAINGGNSGGPLINARGEVIGINSAKISDSTVEGIGFAIPINVLTSKIDVLSKAQLLVGIAGRDINEATAAQTQSPIGILVVEISKDSPASLATMEVGDVITEFDGKKVTTVRELNEIKNTKNAGDVVMVKVYRNGAYKDLQITLIVKP